MRPNGGNPWLDRRDFHWAHQGGARESPSNTIHAMEQGLKAGARGLEFDVHCTSDDQIVLMHDKTLGRTTNAEEVGLGAERLIRHSTLAELEGLDAAYWWVPGQVDDHGAPEVAYELRGQVATNPDLGVPTLDEVLGRFAGPYTIEVKDKRAVRRTIQLLRRHRVAADQVIVTSFRERTVWNLRWRILWSTTKFGIAPGGASTLWFFLRSRRRRARQRSPYVAIQVPRTFSFDLLPVPWRWMGRLLPRRWRSFPIIDDRFLAHAAAAGVAVHVWTINRSQEMTDLLDAGVHGIMTDCPTVLAAVVAERGVR